jgi:hypothetical protein
MLPPQDRDASPTLGPKAGPASRALLKWRPGVCYHYRSYACFPTGRSASGRRLLGKEECPHRGQECEWGRSAGTRWSLV